MLRNRSLAGLRIAFFWIAASRAQTITETLAPDGPTVVVVFTSNPTHGAFLTTIETVSNLRSTPLPNANAGAGFTDHPPSSLPSVTAFGPTTTTDDSQNPAAATSDPTDPTDRHISSSVPMIAGGLAGFIAIMAAILVCCVVRRRKRRRSVRRAINLPFAARYNTQPPPDALAPYPHPRSHFSSPISSLVTPYSDSPSQKTPAQSRNSTERVELKPRNSIPQIVITEDEVRSIGSSNSHRSGNRHRRGGSNTSATSMSSSSLSTAALSDLKPTSLFIDVTQRSLSSTTLASSDRGSAGASSAPPSPILRSSSAASVSPFPMASLSIKDNLSHSSQYINEIHSTLPPEIRRQNLIALLHGQQQTLASSGSRDERTVAAISQLQEQITTLRRQNEGPNRGDAPPAYEDLQ
ncbi:hypothetical protein B0H34DRAFT_791919 [Crassisporium funariophilum]|nr:hypothetical protein B0H34DRAFT_791919 [Crassisporium funariophilum]